ncbi:MAG: hypothetical protein KA206_07260, partial [Paludibacter sp.]|nr:hypothetical protein [Paludibacter sp.]
AEISCFDARSTLGTRAEMNIFGYPNSGKGQKMNICSRPTVGTIKKCIFITVPQLGNPKNEYFRLSQ